MSSLEPQMSSLFNDMVIPPSLKAFTSSFQPGASAALKNMDSNSLLQQPSSFGFSNEGFGGGLEIPFLSSTNIDDNNYANTKSLPEIQSTLPTTNINEIQLQTTSLIREAGSGSSTPSAVSASSIRNSTHPTSSVDSQLAVLRNEMVILIY